VYRLSFYLCLRALALGGRVVLFFKFRCTWRGDLARFIFFCPLFPFPSLLCVLIVVCGWLRLPGAVARCRFCAYFPAVPPVSWRSLRAPLFFIPPLLVTPRIFRVARVSVMHGLVVFPPLSRPLQTLFPESLLTINIVLFL